MVDTYVVPRGLKGVVVTDTEIGDVRGQEGFYHYRQYSAIELATRCSLEDVWHLLIDGCLPDWRQREAFAVEIQPLRHLDPRLKTILRAVANRPVGVAGGLPTRAGDSGMGGGSSTGAGAASGLPAVGGAVGDAVGAASELPAVGGAVGDAAGAASG
ncbi:MAG TPA: citrate/2-methylcitrate synthase, partial [Candidatus Limnocylindrales bacterium]|nr:citrate/2-methylcitrate synthase [Candidatus Limnocylindrales bacterium]